MSTMFKSVNKFVSDFLSSQENSEDLIFAWDELSDKFSKILDDDILNIIKNSVEDGISNALKNDNSDMGFATPKTDKKSRKKKSEVAPGAPKKALNSYILYSKFERASFSEENSELNSKEITSKLAEAWKEHRESNSDIFKKYSELAEKDKERYVRETEEFNNGGLEKKTEVITDSEVEIHTEEKKKKSTKKDKKTDIVSDTEIVEKKKKKKSSKKIKAEVELDDE